ncbi:MAG: CinA family protein [Hyphomonadaceae bacterium]|nr:MAG: competence-damaged inducible protein [Caulobacteraceae bacterium]MBT9446043.1 CinA family protein [Hyphomonadaceae bacterium]TPW07625.1 MAG: competence-damaged inducible protein [Alphaproteobacteria bacterium]
MQSLLPIAARAGDLLKTRNETIAIAESSAGGLISAALLAVPGASAYFLGGGVVYTAESRLALLQMPREEIIRSSEQSALNLARAVRKQLGATWALGETGAAGPTGPSGRLFLAVTGPFEISLHEETGVEDRVENMRRFAKSALNLLVDVLERP